VDYEHLIGVLRFRDRGCGSVPKKGHNWSSAKKYTETTLKATGGNNDECVRKV
jgi:hypothetical protein